MIRYALKCAQGHGFESWFQSAAAFDRLAAAGHIRCPDCGDATVEKGLMAPQVRPNRTDAGGADAGAQSPAAPADAGPLSAPATPQEAALMALRRHVEKTADYVGGTFAAEARRIHAGTVPERPIWGEARIDDARALIEEGINVAPLPFRPTRKSN
jgi:hypothetical protein